MVPKQEPLQPLKRNSPPGGKWPVPPRAERTVVLNTLQALGELTEIQLGLEEGLEFLQLWRRMETENSIGWPQSYPQSSHLGNMAPMSQVLGSMPGR